MAQKRVSGSLPFLLVAMLGVSGLSACSTRPIESRYIVSGSMSPSLQVNDRIVIEKYVNDSEVPQRGDIILFKATDAILKQRDLAGVDENSAFIFRVVGLPGETIAIKQGKVFVNNQPLSEPYITEPPQYEWTTKVPANAWVVLGDNRNNAYDSHYWGAVPRDQIIGKAVSRYFPFSRFGKIQ